MFISVDIFGRGIAFGLHYRDFGYDEMRYFTLQFARRGAVSRGFLLTSSHDGGLEFRYRTQGREQGWRLHGPIEHFQREW